MTCGEREEVDLGKKVRYAESVYDVKGLLGVKCWNAGECFITIVAIMGGANDWAVYVGALPNQFDGKGPTEEEVVRYTVSSGGKMLAKDAAALFGLPERQYRR